MVTLMFVEHIPSIVSYPAVSRERELKRQGAGRLGHFILLVCPPPEWFSIRWSKREWNPPVQGGS